MGREGRERAARVALLGLLVTFAVAGSANAATGDLDPSFGDSGEIVIDLGANESPEALALRPDGRIDVSAQTSGVNTNLDLGLVQLTADGAPDESFGPGGIRTVDFSGGRDNVSGGLVIQPDGKLVAETFTDAGSGGAYDYGLARLLTTGELDPSFGTGGEATASSGVNDFRTNALALLPDGSLLAGASQATNSSDFGLAQFTAAGTVDTSFGIAGFSHADLGGTDYGEAMAVQPDGKIVRVGDSYKSGDRTAVTRVNANGYFDTGFIGGGAAIFNLGPKGSAAYDVAVLPDAKLLVAAYTGGDLAMLRLNPNGTADSSFGTGGLKLIDFGATEGNPKIALQADGKIIVAFHQFTSTGAGLGAIARLGADGSPDPTFAGGGAMVIPNAGYPAGLALASDGDPVATFSTSAGPDPGNILVARLQGDGTPPQPPPTEPPTEPEPANATCAGETATLVGTDGADKLNGSIGDDVIATLGGNDKVKAGKGNDLVCGGDGNDKISGGPGKDVLRGEAGKDKLKGGGAKDKCIGGPGPDSGNCETEHGI
jgi:uncharacterized delta-60 repeat protein